MFHSLTCRGSAPQHWQLLAQDEILGLKPRSPREPRPDSNQQPDQKREHSAALPYAHPRVIPDKVFGRHSPQRVKGGRKNWDEHETKTTNDAPQEGRNNRRTLLITGGKLGSRPWAIRFQIAARDCHWRRSRPSHACSPDACRMARP